MTIYTVKGGSWSGAAKLPGDYIAGERIEPEYVTNIPPNATIDGKQLVPCDTITLPIISGEDVVSVSHIPSSEAAPTTVDTTPCHKRVVDEVPTGTLIYVMNCTNLRDGIYKVAPSNTDTPSICASCALTQDIPRDDSFDPGAITSQV